MKQHYRVFLSRDTIGTLRGTLAEFLARRDRVDDPRAARTNPVEFSAHVALDADRLVRDLAAVLAARPARPAPERGLFVI